MPYTRHVAGYVLAVGGLAVTGAAMRWQLLTAGAAGWAALVVCAALIADGIRALARR